jgi:membrane-associated progesterone receptor component
LAASGTVFNVWKGRHFYGPGCEYHIFAGNDATRLLAKSKLEEETPEERSVPLSIAERANLEGWYWIFKNKYEVCGKLEGYDPKS